MVICRYGDTVTETREGAVAVSSRIGYDTCVAQLCKLILDPCTFCVAKYVDTCLVILKCQSILTRPSPKVYIILDVDVVSVEELLPLSKSTSCHILSKSIAFASSRVANFVIVFVYVFWVLFYFFLTRVCNHVSSLKFVVFVCIFCLATPTLSHMLESSRLLLRTTR